MGAGIQWDKLDPALARLVVSYWRHRNGGGNANQWWSKHREITGRLRLRLRGAIIRSKSARYRIAHQGGA